MARNKIEPRIFIFYWGLGKRRDNYLFHVFFLCRLCHIMVLCLKLYFSILEIAGEWNKDNLTQN